MIWVLVLIFYGSGGGMTTVEPYYTKSSCEEAAKQFVAVDPNWIRFKAVCLPKDKS